MRNRLNGTGLVLLFVFLAAGPALAADGEPIEAAGQIDAVTLYRGQAMVTRRITVDEAQGPRRIVVPNLPAEIVSGSLYAESAEGVTVRSVRYRTRPVMEDVRQQVRELDEQITQLERDIARNEQQREVLEQQKALVKKLEQFSAPSAEWELARGVLDAETIQTLAEFMFHQRQRIADELIALKFEKTDLQEQRKQHMRERNQLTASSSRTAREAVVFADFQQQGGQFELRYLVNEATWSPSYNMRGPAAQDTVQLEYLAAIRQTSGEAWDDVELTLSTASPSLVSEPPALSSLHVNLTAAQQAQAGFDYSQKSAELELRQTEAVRERSANANQPQQQEVDSESALFGDTGGRQDTVAPTRGGKQQMDKFTQRLNKISGDRQVLQMLAGRGRAKDQRPQRDGQAVSVEYTLDGRTSLPSRDDRQLVRIASDELDADFYRVARPVLTEQVYVQAEATNGTQRLLLAGPTQSYLNGQFVGRGALPTVARGESLTAGFGIDSSLHADRTLIDRTERTRGGNRVIELHYRLTLANFDDEARRVRLFDRMPVPRRGSDIQIRLTQTSEKLAQDPGGEQGQVSAQSDGILRWDLDIPAGATDGDAVTVDYHYTIEHDRQKRIEGKIDAQ